jgi:hypothetical protein
MHRSNEKRLILPSHMVIVEAFHASMHRKHMDCSKPTSESNTANLNSVPMKYLVVTNVTRLNQEGNSDVLSILNVYGRDSCFIQTILLL